MSADLNRNKFIVIYPYKFTNFLWDILSLDEFSKYSNVEVWDISFLIDKNFANSVSSASLARNELKKIKSIYSFVLNLRKLIRKNNDRNICILNEVPRSSLIGLLINMIIYFCLRSSAVKVVDLYNPGVPATYFDGVKAYNDSKPSPNFLSRIARSIRNSTNFPEFIHKCITYISVKLAVICPMFLTHRLAAGRGWMREAKKNIKSDVAIVKAHSNDYSIFLKNTNFAKRAALKIPKKAVMLDGAGPLFLSDSALTRRTVPFTTDVWYPALVRFFTLLERETNLIVEIAGHYKSNHLSPSPIFGGRNVVYGRTREMVEECEYVITRCSTAISYAVLYRKPVLFIYSNQLIGDLEVMRHIFGMADMLGTKPINIDLFSGDINDYLRVDEARYANYEQEVLTSSPMGRPNFQIILEDVMGVEL